MINALKWFFNINYDYPDHQIHNEWKWPHITAVVVYMTIMVTLAVVIGILFKNKDYKTKNKVIIVSAILIDSFELVKIIAACIGSDDVVRTILCSLLPLFLCSIQLVAIPMAAFCKGRMKEASLDFVLIFGLLGAIAGTIGAAQNYYSYPVLSFPNIVSGITHSISGFASLYIIISGIVSLKKKNMWITYTILGGFSVLAYVMNIVTGLAYEGMIFTEEGKAAGSNYMFLMYHDGTPYSIFYNMVGGNKVIYPIIVIGVFALCILIAYSIPMIQEKIKEKKLQKTS